MYLIGYYFLISIVVYIYYNNLINYIFIPYIVYSIYYIPIYIPIQSPYICTERIRRRIRRTSIHQQTHLLVRKKHLRHNNC